MLGECLDWMILEGFSNLRDSLTVFSPWVDYGMPGEHSREAVGSGESGTLQTA